MKYDIQAHSAHLQSSLSYLLSTKNLSDEITIVTHSLGGIITREALNHTPQTER